MYVLTFFAFGITIFDGPFKGGFMGLVESLAKFKAQKETQETEELENQRNINAEALMAVERLSQDLSEFAKSSNFDHISGFRLIIDLHSQNCTCKLCKGYIEFVEKTIKRDPCEGTMWCANKDNQRTISEDCMANTKTIKEAVEHKPTPPRITIIYAPRVSYLTKQNHISDIETMCDGIFHEITFGCIGNLTADLVQAFSTKEGFLSSLKTGIFKGLSEQLKEASMIINGSPSINFIDDSLAKSNKFLTISMRP